MRGTILQLGIGLLIAGMLAGCKTHPVVHEPKHPDPLCNSKKPIEGRAHEPEPDATVRIDPQPPPLPTQPGGTVVRQSVPLQPPQPPQLGLK